MSLIGEPKLNYRDEHWEGHTQDYVVRLSDETLHKHLNAYLEVQGISTLSYAEMMERIKLVQEQQCEAFQRFLRLDYWLTCADPDVSVRPLNSAASRRGNEGR